MNQIFEAQAISKSFPRSHFTLKVPELILPEGSITGVVGENGNGKTTLLNIIAGELKSRGTFKYFGEFVYNLDNWTLLKDKIAFIPQRIPKWYGTLIQNLKLKAALENIPSAEIDAYLNEILEFLGLMEYRDLYWTEISTGYRLRFELARVLIGKPRLLVLDEPLANLDINTQQKFLSDLKQILQNKDYTTAVVLSSQQLHEIETVADQMVFLKAGESIFSGNVNKLESLDEKNIYELQVENEENLIAFIAQKDYEGQKHGEYYQLKTPKEVDSAAFLQQVCQAELNVKYFRNISKSTKRLFR